jgi:hypothetical protein
MATTSPVPGSVSDSIGLEIPDMVSTAHPSAATTQSQTMATDEAEKLLQPMVSTQSQSQLLDSSYWTPSKQSALDPSHLQVPRIPRAWERVPTMPATADSRFDTIWRRYNTKTSQTTSTKSSGLSKNVNRRTAKESAAQTQHAKQLSFESPAQMESSLENEQSQETDVSSGELADTENKRPVKRLRTGHSQKRRDAAMQESHSTERALAVATKWERRTSVLPRECILWHWA